MTSEQGETLFLISSGAVGSLPGTLFGLKWTIKPLQLVARLVNSLWSVSLLIRPPWNASPRCQQQ